MEKYISQNSLGDKYVNEDLVAKDNLSKQKRDLLKEMVLSYNQMASDNQQTNYAFIKYHGR
ncbi:hypothetical protein RN70_07930 [Staphylococcus schleiferi]|uniref:Uncharacterized protein n=1 Tax=Staphylococcus coagulans TaxID=74706 RepID=A0ABU1EVN1_9STAP|nr:MULTISPECIES: hypothetical protein [Staphylococcus]AKS67284.1 hypothetical protein LH95_07410 [Staphylococcus schleiferi]AKS69423.1 hypothetical protein NP71_07655 [Staphylococcus schleiferi]AKS71593.1 hypothetical protein OA96_07245 [Staphylococcus schleiferi]AKS73828.1 hypothetical protein RN70_07930 [Staphylococcus schleiferi]MBA8763534.1 hypothetical protein [Staphylococcus coagulans]